MEYYNKYINLEEKDKNLANYINYCKNSAIISLLDKDETHKLIRNYGYQFEYTKEEIILKRRLLREISEDFITDNNISLLEETTNKIVFLLKEKGDFKETHEVVKYEILVALLTNYKLIEEITNKQTINQINKIVKHISKSLNIKLNNYNLTLEDLNKINELINKYFITSIVNNDYVNNCYIYNITTTNNRVRNSVKKIRKVKKAI